MSKWLNRHSLAAVATGFLIGWTSSSKSNDTLVIAITVPLIFWLNLDRFQGQAKTSMQVATVVLTVVMAAVVFHWLLKGR